MKGNESVESQNLISIADVIGVSFNQQLPENNDYKAPEG